MGMATLYVGDSPVTVRRRRVKNLNLYVKLPEGEILLTIPYGVSLKTAEDFLKRKEAWILRAKERVTAAGREEPPVISEEQVRQMKAAILSLAAKWEPLMGVRSSGFTIREMKTRWGSCTVSTGKIRLNLRLAAKPRECLEYVLVHELCHLLEPSHNQRFHALMDQFLPDWRERKKRLNPD